MQIPCYITIYMRKLLLSLFFCASLVASAQNNEQRIERFDSIASSFFVEGRYDDALTMLLNETKLLEKTPGDKRYVEALIKMGLCYEQLNLPFKAIEVNKRAITLYSNQHGAEDLFIANRSNNIAELYHTMDDMKLAHEWSLEAMRISNKIKPNDSERVKHLTTASKTAFSLGHHDEAIDYQKELIEVTGRHLNPHHDDYLQLLATLRAYYSAKGDNDMHAKVSEQIRQLKKEIDDGIIPEPTDLSTPLLCRRHNLEALLCCRWMLGNYLSTEGMKQAAEFIIQFRKNTPDAAVYVGPAEDWVRKHSQFYVIYIAASIEYALQHPEEQRFSVEQYKAVMYRFLDYYKQNKDFAGEIKRMDTYLALKDTNPEELEKRFEKNFKQFTDAMNSKKKGKFVVDDPVLLDFSY